MDNKIKSEPTVTFIFEEHTIKTTAIEMTEREIEEFFKEMPYIWEIYPHRLKFLNTEAREYIGDRLEDFRAKKYKATRIIETEEKLPVKRKELGNYEVYRLQLMEKYGARHNFGYDD